MKANKVDRVSNYVKHIAFCFKNTRPGNYLATSRIAAAYLGLHLGLFKHRNKALEVGFDDFDVELNIYSREVAGYWEIFLEDQYLDLPPRNQDEVVVLDIGANVGFFAIKQALKHRANLKLIAFEPDPGTYLRLQSNIGKINTRVGSQIKCCNCAIDARVGEAKFLQDLSLESRIVDDAALDTNHSFIKVPITTLDAVVDREGLERIDLMKIDVEGHELKVLAGAGKALSITDNITLEYHAPHFVREIPDLLAPYHFRVVSHNPIKSILSFSRNVSRPHRQVAAGLAAGGDARLN